MNIKITIISIFAIMIAVSGCKREADALKVQNNFVEKKVTSKLEPNEINIDPRMRSMTLLSYPVTNDIEGWSFSIQEETRSSWDLFIQSLSFGDKIKTNFDNNSSPMANIIDVVNVVQSAGESRDQSFKKIVPLKKELAKIDVEINALKTEQTPKDLETFVCYYSKRPTGTKPFECKTTKDETYSKERTVDNCRDFLRLKFIDISENPTIAERIVQCDNLQLGLDELKEKSLTIDQKIANEMLVRSAGESVVIDLLQSIEQHQKNLVLIATGATLEKNKDQNDPVSKIVIEKNNSISEFNLIIDFGPNLSSGSGKVEYSREAGNIKNLSFKKEEDGVWTLRFDLVTSDFTIKTTLAYSSHQTLGMRFVGDAHFYYPNGMVRKGVMKLEFDQL